MVHAPNSFMADVEVNLEASFLLNTSWNAQYPLGILTCLSWKGLSIVVAWSAADGSLEV